MAEPSKWELLGVRQLSATDETAELFQGLMVVNRAGSGEPGGVGGGTRRLRGGDEARPRLEEPGDAERGEDPEAPREMTRIPTSSPIAG